MVRECALRELALQRGKTKIALPIVSENKLYASIAEPADAIVEKDRFAHCLTLASRRRPDKNLFRFAAELKLDHKSTDRGPLRI